MAGPLKTPLIRRKSSSIGSIIGRLFATLTLLLVLLGIGGFVAWTAATSDGPLTKNKIVDIPTGSSATEIAGKLEQEGVVDSALLTSAGIIAARYVLNAEPKAGEYEFTAGSSLLEVFRKLKSGKRIFYKLSVPEGFTTWQVMERVMANEVLTGEIETIPVEGELLPDTYVFYRGRTRQSIIDQMKAAQLKLVEDLWPARAEGLPLNTPQEALILASIVEKETGKAEERAHVAAVFVNRMRKGMRLQSDPTIIYGITQGQGKLDRPIYRSDIRKKTNYNTYQIDGLPPTPIANAGRASIKAVLNPIDTKDVFFVADGTGGHVFAETLAEHNANVKKWRSWLKEQREEQAAAEEEKVVETNASETTEPEATNTDAPLPVVTPEAAIDNTSGETDPASESETESASSFKVVEVSGRSVPIPRDKPQRQ
jgi:UPF0755 protein